MSKNSKYVVGKKKTFFEMFPFVTWCRVLFIFQTFFSYYPPQKKYWLKLFFIFQKKKFFFNLFLFFYLCVKSIKEALNNKTKIESSCFFFIFSIHYYIYLLYTIHLFLILNRILSFFFLLWILTTITNRT